MAAGTKFIKEINDQFLICKICFESYKDPKTLTCLHTFCGDCLQQHIDSERERTSRFSMYSRYIACPLCRKKTEIPSGGVRRLPDNFLVSNLTDVVNRRRSAKVPSCEICQTMRSRTHQASSKCLECSKLLCKSCVTLHRKTKVTEHHSLFDIDDEKDIECKVHPEEIVRFYCEPCETCVCIVCTFQEHRDHEICSFSEGFERNKSTIETLLNRCKERASEVQSHISTVMNYEQLKKDTQETIRDLAISYTSQVRAMEKKLLKTVDSIFEDSEILTFLQSKDNLRETLDSIRSTCNLTEIVMKDKNIEMLLLKKEIQGKLTVLMEPALPSIPSDLSNQIKFIPGSVELGYLSVINDSNDGESDSQPTDTRCMETQTRVVSLEDTSTTMGCNLSESFVDISKGIQTEAIESAAKANKEVATISVHTRETGVDACLFDVKTKGVNTERKGSRAAKCQTEKPVTFDQQNMTSIPSSDASVNTPIREMINKLIQVYPDVVNRGVLAKVQTSESESLTDLAFTPNSPEPSIMRKHRLPVTNGDFSPHPSPPTSRSAAVQPRPNRFIYSRGVQTEQEVCIRLVKTVDCSMMTEPVLISDNYESLNDSKTSRCNVKIQTDVVPVFSNHFDGFSNTLCRKCRGVLTNDDHSAAGEKTFLRRRSIGTKEWRVKSNLTGTEMLALTQDSTNSANKEPPAPTTKESGTHPIRWRTCSKYTETEAVKNTDKAISTSVSMTDTSTSVDKYRLGLRHKSTSTPYIETSEFHTQTGNSDVRDKATWSHVRQTTKGTCTDRVNIQPLISKSDRATNTTKRHTTNRSTNVSLQMTDSYTEMTPIQQRDEKICASPSMSNSSTSTETLHTAEEDTDNNLPAIASTEVAIPQIIPVRCFVNEACPVLVDNSTGMSPVYTQDRDTLTERIIHSHQWTITDVTPVSHASTVTNQIFTNDVGVSTLRTITTDQFTNTPILDYRESETEAVIPTVDNETLTEMTMFSDAQTGSEVTFSDSTTWIDFQSHLETDTMTETTNIKDKELMVRPFMFSRKINTSPEIDNMSRSMDGGQQTSFPPLLTRSLPESLFTFLPSPPGISYHEISIPVPTTERGTMSSPVATCDQGTMALSILPFDDAINVSTQTPGPMLVEAGVVANIEQWPYLNETDLSYEEKATSTESLVYMGLLTALDNVDELFFVPNLMLETVSSTTSLSDVSMETDHIEMLDQGMSTEEIHLFDCGTQTYLTITPDDQTMFDVDYGHYIHDEYTTPYDLYPTSVMVDASTNTRSVRTMCRETSTPPRHSLTKSTMTFYVAKVDKSTNTARRWSRGDPPAISTSDMAVSTDSLVQADKDTMTVRGNFRDSSVSTDSVFLDEKMAECIVKLKSVTKRLHSPTTKTSPGGNPLSPRSLARRNMPDLEQMLIQPRDTRECAVTSSDEGEFTSLPSLSEDDRKKHVQDLLAQTQAALQKPKSETPRKIQPITTLKAKTGDRLAAIEEEHYKSRSLPRQFSERDHSPGVRMGRHAMTPSRLPLLRYNSAPGRIATFPAQTVLNIKAISKSPTPTRIPTPVVPHMSISAPVSVPADNKSTGPLPSLPSISETRTPSSCSTLSAVSTSSVETSSSGAVSDNNAPPQLVKRPPLMPSNSTSSSSSAQSTLEGAKSARKSAMSFMQKLLPRRKKNPGSPPVKRAANQSENSAGSQMPPKSPPMNKPPEKSPKSPKKSRPFVYMRQRIFSIHHDGESSKSNTEKGKKSKSKSKSKPDANSPDSKSRSKKDPDFRDPPPPSAPSAGQSFPYVELC